MKRSLLLSGILVALVCAASGCESWNKLMTSIFGGKAEEESQEAVQESPEEFIFKPLIKVDGSPDDWVGIQPLWEEAGDVVGDPGFSVDVKQIYFTNDIFNLYIFMKHVPDVKKRFKNQPFVGRFGDMYFDVDNDRHTGTTDAELETYGYPNGYEKGLALEIGIHDGEMRRFPFVSHTLKRLDREGVEQALEELSKSIVASNPIMRQIIRRHLLWERIEEGSGVSHAEKDVTIAFGLEGTEIALSMDVLEIYPETTIRILFSEEANDFMLDGLSTRYYTVWTEWDVSEYEEYRKAPGDKAFREVKKLPDLVPIDDGLGVPEELPPAEGETPPEGEKKPAAEGEKPAADVKPAEGEKKPQAAGEKKEPAAEAKPAEKN